MADFDQAFEVLMIHEGGYVNHPKDPGGETAYGISKRAYPDLDIKMLTREDAKEIYRRDWWVPNRYGEIQHQALAEKVFSLAVNMGARRANKLLQRAVNKVEKTDLLVDGVMGVKTLTVLNNAENPDHILAELKLLAVQYYLDLGTRDFLKGWIRRAIA